MTADARLFEVARIDNDSLSAVIDRRYRKPQ
jgi:hypothetical protein